MLVSDVAEASRQCTNHLADKPVSHFSPSRHGKFGRMAICRVCDSQRKREITEAGLCRYCHTPSVDGTTLCATHREASRWRNLYNKYGLTREQYHQLLEAQNGKCPITGDDISESGRNVHVDHCHRTGVVRGILSRRANQYLGQFHEDPELILRAAHNAVAYLKRAKQND